MITRTLTGLALIAFPITAAQAANLTITINNQSGGALNQVAVVSNASPGITSANLLSSTAASGASGVIIVPAATGECVFTLKLTFATGQTIERPETDLCQTDSIIVE